MKRTVLQLLLVLLVGTAPAWGQQVRVRPVPPQQQSPILTHPQHGSPARGVPGATTHPAAQIHGSSNGSTNLGQPAAHAPERSSDRGNELVIPTRPSADFVPNNSANGPAGFIGGMSVGEAAATAPAPEQPLGNVLIRPRESVRITVRAISAERAGASLEIDGRLGPIDHDLRSFADQFSYRSYRLLDVQTFDLDFRSVAQMDLPGSHSLEIEPRLIGADGWVKMHLEVLRQTPEHATRMRTDFSIPRGVTMLVGGYRIDPELPERGTLLIAITQDE